MIKESEGMMCYEIVRMNSQDELANVNRGEEEVVIRPCQPTSRHNASTELSRPSSVRITVKVSWGRYRPTSATELTESFHMPRGMIT